MRSGSQRSGTFAIVIPVMNQHDVTKRLIQSWIDLAKTKLTLLFIDNGSEEPLADQEFISEWSAEHNVKCFRLDENIGVYPTFQLGFDCITGFDFIFYSHNDVEMIDYGWDEKMMRILSSLHNPGVCGMFGARGLGTEDIYKSNYHFTQLQRWDCVTVKSMLDQHGDLIQRDYEEVVVLDGFSLIVNREMMLKSFNGNFDHGRYPPHHMYDIRICLKSHLAGYSNYVIDIDCKHHGGITSTREKWAQKFGSTDLAIHRKAHKVFYEEFRGKLPVSVKKR